MLDEDNRQLKPDSRQLAVRLNLGLSVEIRVSSSLSILSLRGIGDPHRTVLKNWRSVWYTVSSRIFHSHQFSSLIHVNRQDSVLSIYAAHLVKKLGIQWIV